MKNQLTDAALDALLVEHGKGDDGFHGFARAVIAAHEAASSEKRAPVQGLVGGIPWSLHLEAYAAYSKKWAPQPALIDLEGRGCRGGFGLSELDEFIPGWRERISERTAMKAEIAALKAALLLAQDALNSIDVGYRSRDGIALEVSVDETKVNAALEAIAQAVQPL